MCHAQALHLRLLLRISCCMQRHMLLGALVGKRRSGLPAQKANCTLRCPSFTEATSSLPPTQQASMLAPQNTALPVCHPGVLAPTCVCCDRHELHVWFSKGQRGLRDPGALHGWVVHGVQDGMLSS